MRLQYSLCACVRAYYLYRRELLAALPLRGQQGVRRLLVSVHRVELVRCGDHPYAVLTHSRVLLRCVFNEIGRVRQPAATCHLRLGQAQRTLHQLRGPQVSTPWQGRRRRVQVREDVRAVQGFVESIRRIYLCLIVLACQSA